MTLAFRTCGVASSPRRGDPHRQRNLLLQPWGAKFRQLAQTPELRATKSLSISTTARVTSYGSAQGHATHQIQDEDMTLMAVGAAEAI